MNSHARPPLRLRLIVFAGRATRDPIYPLWTCAVLLAVLIAVDALTR